jgi:hypothetical protein
MITITDVPIMVSVGRFELIIEEDTMVVVTVDVEKTVGAVTVVVYVVCVIVALETWTIIAVPFTGIDSEELPRVTKIVPPPPATTPMSKVPLE